MSESEPVTRGSITLTDPSLVHILGVETLHASPSSSPSSSVDPAASQSPSMSIEPGIDVQFVFAAIKGDIPHLQRLVAEYGIGEGPGKVSAATLIAPDGSNALHLAAAEGKSSTCRYLIEDCKLDVNGTSDNGETPLFQAINGKRWSTLNFLLDNGADVTKRNIYGATPLHCAASCGSMEIVKLLISKGADVHTISQRGMPLHFAARSGHSDIVKYFLDFKAHAHPNMSSLEMSPLLESMIAGSFECIQLLLKAGADPNQHCHILSPLRVAVFKQHEGLISCLLKAGADANMPDPEGYTPLEIAALLGNREVVRLLFPFTSRIARYPVWTVNGVMQHARSNEERTLHKSREKEMVLLGKKKGNEAFARKKYCDAHGWYTPASEIDPTDAKVFSNMSLCCIKVYDGPKALRDAQACVRVAPHWAKAHFRLGAAWMLCKSFENAVEAFSRALALEPGNEEIANGLREAQAKVERFSSWETMVDLERRNLKVSGVAAGRRP